MQKMKRGEREKRRGGGKLSQKNMEAWRERRVVLTSENREDKRWMEKRMDELGK